MDHNNRSAASGWPGAITPVTAATLEAVLPLIAAYQRFYGVAPDEQRNRAHFGALIEDPGQCRLFVAAAPSGEVVGFATLYFPLGSLAAGRSCLLNDLYVVPSARGRGVGRALIVHCAGIARDLGYARLAWHTAQSNATAQRLYDSLPTSRTACYTYSLPTDLGGHS